MLEQNRCSVLTFMAGGQIAKQTKNATNASHFSFTFLSIFLLLTFWGFLASKI